MTFETFELKLENGKWAEWQGRDGLDACQRYADAHRGVAVIAWREPRVLFVAGVNPANIKHAGDR